MCTAPLSCTLCGMKIGGLGGQMFLELNPTSPNDLHLSSLYRHVLSCASEYATSVCSDVSV